MQIRRPLRQHIAKYRAAAQSLRLWVMEVFAWWVAMFGDRNARLEVQRETIEARAQVRDLVFVMMVSRMTFQRREHGWMRPPSARRGFRYAWRSIRPRRIYTRGLELRSLKDIRRVLDDIDAVVTRLIARVPKSAATGALVAVAPPRLTLACNAPPRCAEAADTS